MANLNCYLPSTNDKTDRTRDILDKLTEYGQCILGAGIYVVSGLDMPDHTLLSGAGSASVLLLDEQVEEGYAVKVGSYCTIRDVRIEGAPGVEEWPDVLGGRDGILFKGNATPGVRTDEPRNNIITGCYISDFSGGGIRCCDTGYNSVSSLIVTACHILYCGAGIYISHFSEFNKFDGVLSEKCLYGCINNGGNNVFTNCGFNNNATAWLMDNSDGKAANNSHGSAVGCTFNHSGGVKGVNVRNEGVALHAIGMDSGFIFSGGQMFYGKIVLEKSKGFVFDTFNFGSKGDITVRGGGLTMFSNCAFGERPERVEVTDNDHVKFVNCYTRDGEAVEG